MTKGAIKAAGGVVWRLAENENGAKVEVAVIHTGVARRLEDSAYAERRAACESAAANLGLPTLRDATINQVAADPFARHVVSENGVLTSGTVVVITDALLVEEAGHFKSPDPTRLLAQGRASSAST